MTTEADEAVATFEPHRTALLGLAYRTLGSMWDAEDVVQESFLRWSQTDRSKVQNPRGFLVTVTTRLAIDQLRSARRTREAYPGPWLPEPVETRRLGPLDSAELRDSVSFGALHLMEQLSAHERAVFILREAFVLPFQEIATILDTSVVNCRQLLSRSRRRLDARRESVAAPETLAQRTRLVTRFLEAASSGDLDALTSLLAEDVVVYNDGGGQVRAALRPITGRAKVAAFVTGLTRRFPAAASGLIDLNGQPGLATSIDGRRQATLFEMAHGRITAIYAVLNPEKLSRIGTTPAAAAADGAAATAIRP